MKIEDLSIDNIDLKDERFRISYYASLDKLVLSLTKIGLVNPLVITLRDRRYILVSGWKRIQACLKLSLSTIPVTIIDESDDLKVFKMVFYENFALREFSLMEKAEVLSKLKGFGEEVITLVNNYLPLLGIPPSLQYLESYLTYSQFDPELKRALQEREMTYASLQHLAEFTSRERKSLLPLLSPLGRNKRKEILEDLQEISQRDDCDVEDILALKEIKNVIDSGKLSLLQKADNVRILLRRKRYPTFFKYKDAFDSHLRKMHWPKGLSIDHSPYFEDEGISVNFDFTDKDEFIKKLSKLHEMASNQEFSYLLKPISDD